MRALIVDDDPGIREIVAETARGLGYEVDEAGSALRALEVVQDRKPGLIMLDLRMPKVRGEEFIHLLRHFMDRDDARIVVMTGDTAAIPDARNNPHVSLVLRKPFDLRTLEDIMEGVRVETQGGEEREVDA